MHLDQARELARSALPRWGLPAESGISFVKYRENHVFRADAPSGESYALRLHRPGYRTENEIDTELRYVGALHARGVPVPEVVPTVDGARLARIEAPTTDGTTHSRSVSLLRWFPGAGALGDAGAAFVGEDDSSPEDFGRIGALLARLHLAAQSIGRPDWFDRRAWDTEGLAGARPLWGDPRRLVRDDVDHAVLGEALSLLRAQLAETGEGPAVFGIVHADTTPENILLTPGGLKLIDFDDFGAGWFVFDLVTALFHHTPHPRYAEYAQALLAGYEAIRPLRTEEHAIWDGLMLARGLSYLGWAADRPGDPAAEFVAARVAPWVVRAAEAFVAGSAMPWQPAVRTSPTAALQEER
ncbi:phosphotransferase [Georgenia halophila]|uniref:Phosphotransferase n=1 Tax=Georgenia halophila TaxID=620889 RepID=A0ABP8LKG3_9MICO